MKKISYIVFFYLLTITSQIKTESNDTSGKNYIANLSGRTIILNFYAKNPFTKKSTWYDTQIFGPLLIAGKSPSQALDIISSSLLPSPIDMHPLTCYKITVNALKINSKKLKDKSIKGCTIPTPSVALLTRDYKITLENNQLIVYQLNTHMGLPIPGLKQSDIRQWPSEKDLAIVKMNPIEQINYYKKIITDLEHDIKELTQKIKNMHDSHNNIKVGKLTKVNNRHKMIANKKELIQKYTSRIKKLEEKIKNPTNDSTNNSDDLDDSDDFDDLDDSDNTLEKDAPEKSVENTIVNTTLIQKKA